MEIDSIQNIQNLEKFKKAIEDINYLLSIAERKNVVRQLNEFKMRIEKQIEELKSKDVINKFKDNIYEMIKKYSFEDTSQYAK
jgi:hypothetical protein